MKILESKIWLFHVIDQICSIRVQFHATFHLSYDKYANRNINSPHCQVMRNGFLGRTNDPMPVKPVDRPTNVSVLWTRKAGQSNQRHFCDSDATFYPSHF